MSHEPEVTRIVRSWLEEGVTSLPDRVLDSVLDQLPATPQRRARWPAWRLNTMATPIRLAVTAAAIGALAVVVGIVPRSGEYGGPSPSESPSPSPSPVLLEAYAPDLAAGTYVQPFGAGSWTISVPEGWEVFYGVIFKNLDGQSDIETMGGPGEVAFGWWEVAHVFTDPCRWKETLPDPPVGATVDDLVSAFLAQSGRNGSVTDAVFAGYPAKRVELSVPADLDVTTCDDEVYWEFVQPGDSPLRVPDGYSTPNASGQISVLYILDIQGTRMVMNTWHHPETRPQDLAEMEAMLASSRIDPPAPGPSPAP